MKLKEMADVNPRKKMLALLTDDFYRGDWDDYESWAENIYNQGFPALDAMFHELGEDAFLALLDSCIKELRTQLQ